MLSLTDFCENLAKTQKKMYLVQQTTVGIEYATSQNTLNSNDIIFDQTHFVPSSNINKNY